MYNLDMPALISPDRLLPHDAHPVVFLAGSIEMGKAVDWQTEITAHILAHVPNAWVCNPRRVHWDNSWEQSINNPLFAEQVHWELDHLARCDVAIFYFQPGTQSPITLMELGHRLASQTKNQRTLVCCPDGFWRKGNVEIMCERHHIDVVDCLDTLMGRTVDLLHAIG